MTILATLRQSGGFITLSIPKALAGRMAVQAGSVVELTLEGHTLLVVPLRRGLAERLACSPRSPATWHRDADSLGDAPFGRERL